MDPSISGSVETNCRCVTLQMTRYYSTSSVTFKRFLPPANEVCEGYVFTPVCQSFCSSVHRGGVPGQVHPRQVHLQACSPPAATPPGQVHPQAGTPLLPDRYTPRQVHPPGRYTPQASTPPGAVHAGRYGQQVSSTHPTGMHSFLVNRFRISWNFP